MVSHGNRALCVKFFYNQIIKLLFLFMRNFSHQLDVGLFESVVWWTLFKFFIYAIHERLRPISLWSQFLFLDSVTNMSRTLSFFHFNGVSSHFRFISSIQSFFMGTSVYSVVYMCCFNAISYQETSRNISLEINEHFFYVLSSDMKHKIQSV